MIFSEPIFIFFFLPIVFVVHFVLCKFGFSRCQIIALSLFSLIFYIWWYIDHLLIFVTTIFFNFTLGQLLGKSKNKWLLCSGIIINLLGLFYYKYANFFAPSYFDPIILPLAISFFTFQQIAYLVDTYHSGNPENNIFSYIFFISFFPQLIAGPIVHHGMIRSQVLSKAYAFINSEKIRWGASLFLIGLSKKLVADSLAPMVDYTFTLASENNLNNAALSWCGALSFYLQIYFDFSGYSDMARGLGWLFGFEIPINFNVPYRSTNFIDFWRRWHITLSHFLRDYLYIPLGGNRQGGVRHFLSIVATMGLGGLWHGANWTFVIWGFIHGLLLFFSHYFKDKIKFITTTLGTFSAWIGLLFTNLIVFLLWVLFRSDSLLSAREYYWSMFNKPFLMENFMVTVQKLYANHPLMHYFPSNWIKPELKVNVFLIVTIIFFTGSTIVSMNGPTACIISERKMTKTSFFLYMLLAFVAIIYLIEKMNTNSFVAPFIYFQF